MLISLSIRDIVLIERLDLSFAAGLSVFTGETGAGKSILLDSLGLALGARAESGLVRHGATQASVSAEFDPPPGHPARALLAERDMDAGDAPLVLMRHVQTRAGRQLAQDQVQQNPLIDLGLLQVRRPVLEPRGVGDVQHQGASGVERRRGHGRSVSGGR